MADVKFDLGPLSVCRSEAPHDDQFAIGLGVSGSLLHGCHPDPDRRDYLLASGVMPERYAHLFAASPDLYEALERITKAYCDVQSVYRGDGLVFPEVLAARAALSKANGGDDA